MTLAKISFYCGQSRVLIFLGPRHLILALSLGPLGPLNFIVTVSRNRLIWPGWSIKILHKNKVIFKNARKTHYQQINFSCLFVKCAFSTKPFVNSSSGIVVLMNTTNIKFCMFRGLPLDLIKVWNCDILLVWAISKLHKCYK